MEIALSLLVAHFVGDFLLQSDRMAVDKSRSWSALSDHCVVYSLIVGTYLGTLYGGIIWYLAVFAPHFVTDAITSRINARLWQANRRHAFFCMIGLDQLLHYAQLILTVRLLS